jgi:hypothetical protein
VYLLEMSSVNITASSGPCELLAEVTTFLGLVLIFVVPEETLALRKSDATRTALGHFNGHFFSADASVPW